MAEALAAGAAGVRPALTFAVTRGVLLRLVTWGEIGTVAESAVRTHRGVVASAGGQDQGQRESRTQAPPLHANSMTRSRATVTNIPIPFLTDPVVTAAGPTVLAWRGSASRRECSRCTSSCRCRGPSRSAGSGVTRKKKHAGAK
jgi:hypothetical protein